MVVLASMAAARKVNAATKDSNERIGGRAASHDLHLRCLYSLPGDCRATYSMPLPEAAVSTTTSHTNPPPPPLPPLGFRTGK